MVSVRRGAKRIVKWKLRNHESHNYRLCYLRGGASKCQTLRYWMTPFNRVGVMGETSGSLRPHKFWRCIQDFDIHDIADGGSLRTVVDLGRFLFLTNFTICTGISTSQTEQSKRYDTHVFFCTPNICYEETEKLTLNIQQIPLPRNFSAGLSVPRICVPSVHLKETITWCRLYITRKQSLGGESASHMYRVAT